MKRKNMIKKLIIATIFIITNIAYSQENIDVITINKNKWYVSGGLALTTLNSALNQGNTTNARTNNLGFSLSPKVGYAIKDNLTVGLGVGYAHNTSTYYNGDFYTAKSQNDAYSIYPFIKKFFNVNNRVFITLQGEAKYTRATSTGESTQNNFPNNINITNSTANVFEIGIRPGFTYFIGKNIAFEATIGFLKYGTSTITIDNSQTEPNSGEFNFDLNPSNLIFGFAIFF